MSPKSKLLVGLGYALIVIVVLAMMDKGINLVMDGLYYQAAYKGLFLAALVITFLTGRMSKHQ